MKQDSDLAKIVQVGDWISDYQGRMGTVVTSSYDEQLKDMVFTVRTSYGVDIDLLGNNITFVAPGDAR